jgi:ribonuclease P protein component
VRVRKNGKSLTHHLVVLVYHPNSMEVSRFGVAASHYLGNAVQRNKVKRRLRACLQELHKKVNPGWDVIILARKAMVHSSYQELPPAILRLLEKAELITDTDLRE